MRTIKTKLFITLDAAALCALLPRSGVAGAGIVSHTVKPGTGKRHSGAISIVAANGGTGIKGRASIVVSQAERYCGAGF